MPPARTKKDRASGPSKAVAIQSPNTPTERESRQHAPSITEAQKQALIDNLQLEITERARKLRAQYALHAQGLKSRLEMRINRIPQSLRHANIEDLIEKYAQDLEPPAAQPVPAAYKPAFSRTTTASSKESVVMAPSPVRRGLKRDSTEMLNQSDKENMGATLDLPKKRAKTTTTTAASKTAAAPGASAKPRTDSRKIDPSKVLSPKSHNSRTYPASPLKVSPGKSGLARPASPIKPGTVAAATASLASLVNTSNAENKAPSSSKASSAASSRNASKQVTNTTGTVRGRGAAAARNMAPPPVPAKTTGRGRAASQSSQTSDSSAQTTIVRKTGVVRKAVSKATGLTAAAAGKRTAAARKEVPAPSAAGNGGRTLRSRR